LVLYNSSWNISNDIKTLDHFMISQSSHKKGLFEIKIWIHTCDLIMGLRDLSGLVRMNA
jgi:hypothetical protein